MKLFKNTEKYTPINYLDTKIQVEIPENYSRKPFRALWVSNVANIDLPTITNVEDYKSQVIQMLDTCMLYNLSAIFFQVRTTNDAFYESKLNPYSRYLTEVEGTKPPFDVLKWIIEESKKRGLEFHAWCNPYRISMDGKLSIKDYLDTCDDLNYAKKHPEDIILDTKGKLILNPTKPSVKKHIIDSMIELVKNYDVDGIHFDDYFYPYSGLDKSNDDSLEYANRIDKKMTLGDFRRANVNEVIKGIYDALKKIDKRLQFGVSPFGIWKNKSTDPLGSNTAAACSESYNNQYADTVEWVKKGYVDYIVPQIYWEFGHKIAPFADICDFWVKTCEDTKVKLYVGHGAYRLGNEGEFGNKEEIINQVKYANQFDIVKGNVFFTYKTFIDKEKSYEGMQLLKELLNEV